MIDPYENWLKSMPTCDVCGEKYGGSHYHCSCGSKDVTSMYGHHGRYCKRMNRYVDKFHHCGPEGCDLE